MKNWNEFFNLLLRDTSNAFYLYLFIYLFIHLFIYLLFIFWLVFYETNEICSKNLQKNKVELFSFRLTQNWFHIDF